MNDAKPRKLWRLAGEDAEMEEKEKEENVSIIQYGKGRRRRGEDGMPKNVYVCGVALITATRYWAENCVVSN